MASKSDQELVIELQAGNRAALGELFDRQSPMLYDFIYRLIGDRDQSARLLEEIFTRIPTTVADLDEHIPVRGWLYGLARELSLNLLRQKDWLEGLPPSDEPSVSGLIGDIWRAARAMPAFHRAVLVVEELHGLSPIEKAHALDVMRTDLPRLLEDARHSFENQFDLQARQHGRPLAAQIDPERIWGVQRRMGAGGSLFGYLPALVLPDSLAEMIRTKVMKTARVVGTAAPGTEPAPVEPVLEEAEPELVSLVPPPVIFESIEPASAGCSPQLIGLALAIALVITVLAIGVGYALTRDSTGPVISRIEPAENVSMPTNPLPGATTTRINVSATFRDDRGIDIKATRLVLDGRDVTAQATANDLGITYGADLDPGTHVVLVEAGDTSSNKTKRSWQFTVGSLTPEPTNTATATSTPTITATATPTLTHTPSPTPTGTATFVPPATIGDFSANGVTSLTITRGTSVLLRWTVTGADQVFLNQDKVDPVSSRLVAPTATTIYHLIANNAGGTVERQVTITIQELPDLVVGDIVLMPTNEIMYVIRNNGTAGTARTFLIQVTATTNNVVIESDRPVSAIPPGQEARLLVPNYTVVGSQTIRVQVNLLQEVQESDYTNNELTRTLTGPTITPSPTATPIPTNTPTLVPTNTPTPTLVPTNTPTPTLIPTNTPTNTPNPTRTPTNTPTATPVPTAVTSVVASVDPATYSGACPGNFNFSAAITSNGPGVVTFRWERSDGITKASAAITFVAAGTQTVTDQPWTSAPTGASWERLHVTAPNDIASNQATFTNSCH